MQRRMGILFSICFGAWYAIHIVIGFSETLSLSVIVDLSHICILSSFILSLVSVYSNKTLGSVFQISIVVFQSFVSLYSGTRGLFAGLSFVFIAILLAYNYGIYNKHRYLRVAISVVFIYLMFAFSPSIENGNRFINALSWVCFICGMCFITWNIFKDAIEKLESDESKNKERYLQIIEEATSVARDALNALEKLGNKKDC